MALTDAQKVTLAEIVQVDYETIDSLVDAANFITAQETVLAADIVTWNANRDDVDVELEGGSKGVNYKVKRLLAEIRMRTRKAFNLPLISDEVNPGSRSVAHTWIF